MPGSTGFIQGTIEPAFAIASDGRVVAVNAAGATLFGRPATDLVGRSCSEVVSALGTTGDRVCRADGCPTLEALAAGRATGLPWCAWLTPSGARLPVSAAAIAVPRDDSTDGTAALIIVQVGSDDANVNSTGAQAAGDPAWPSEQRAVRVRLLGRPECTLDGEVRPVQRRRSFELVALLAFAGSAGMRRDQICDALWPEAPAGGGRGHLRVLLHSLRQSLGVDVASSRDEPGLRDVLRLAPGIQVDVVSFEHSAQALLQPLRSSEQPCSTERLDRLEDALSKYVGDLDETGSFGVWSLPHRERLRSLYVAMLGEGARLAATLGDVPRVIDYCRRAVGADPLHEAFQIALINTYGQLGRRREATEQYRSYCRLLASELAIRPSMAVERAIEQAMETS